METRRQFDIPADVRVFGLCCRAVLGPGAPLRANLTATVRVSRRGT
jgi:hypothetical protein